eukprot:TRINITY_DN26364_c0_g2_i1.p1 TRINITY_DN26364_c0_g2~~TRINITY_DN26364_c0_g2_i1.p1  ORF type:complete len:853 (-),score=122.70 TRINITY_DN26364_c0_g2_i1:71-2599(-)
MASTACCCPLPLGGAAAKPSARVVLDVGGHRFTTSRTTLASGRAAGSKLAELVSGQPDPDGIYFLDREGTQFHYILNYVRDGPNSVVWPDSTASCRLLLQEAKVLQLTELAASLETYMEDRGMQSKPEQPLLGARIPNNEAERMAKLKSLNVLDTQNTGTEYDDMTRVVAGILKVPICLVSLVAEDRQWFKSKTGLDADQTSRSSSFCAFTLSPEPTDAAAVLVVEDACRDSRFAENPLVTGDPLIRFYTGCPLITSEGLRMGSLCAIDRIPRPVTSLEVGLLINFAYLCAQSLERRQIAESEDIQIDDDGPLLPLNFNEGPFRKQAMKDALDTAILLVWARPDVMDWPIFFANDVWARHTGRKITSPFVTRAGGCRISDPSSLESIWDYLQLSCDDATGVSRIWQMVKGSMQASQQYSQGLAVDVLLKKTNARGKVSCRFVPAEYPMCEAAASVKALGLGQQSQGQWPTPQGLSAGHWFFVQLRPGMVENQRSSLISPTAASTAKECESLLTPGGSMPLQGKLQVKPPPSPFDDVRLVRLVGSGSFGSVYFSLWSGAAVAVKVINKALTPEQDVSGVQMQFEAMLSASISHPNLVQTFKHGTRTSTNQRHDDSDAADAQAAVAAATSAGERVPKGGAMIHETWIVQEWCDLGTLHERCTKPRSDQASLSETMEIALEIARAGAYLHDLSIIHGDLTASNVLLKGAPVRKGFVCKICDFGLARVLDGASTEIFTKTLGTVSHMPPELFGLARNECKLTKKADVYAWGMVLYEVITGQVPHRGLSPPQIVIKVSRGACLPLPEEVPESLSQLYAGSVARQAEDRLDFHAIITRLSDALAEIQH